MKWKRLPYKNVFFSNKYFFNSKQIWPFLCRRNFLKKANCFKIWGEKRLQKVDLIEYIFLPQNFLRRVMPTKTSRKRMRSRGARKEYATYGGKFSLFDWNFTKHYAAFAIHTLIFRWAPSTWSLTAANFYREPEIYISKIQFKLINYQQKHLRSQNEAVKENFQICHTHEANAARNFAIMCVLIKSWDLIHKDFQRCILLNSLTFWLWDFFADISRWAFSVVVFLHDYLLENVDVFSSKILYTCNAPNSDCKR